MALSAIARFTQSLRGWCMARPAGAALTALALGGVIAGGAMAISPTVETTRVFRGGIDILVTVDPAVDPTVWAYTVPAGRKFMLTDLVISNNGEATAARSQFVFTGTTASCSSGPSRTNSLNVPAEGTLHLPFVTGIGFTAGQHVCIGNGDSADQTDWTIRGYLFE